MSVWWEVAAMCKLLFANLARLWRDKVFWICTVSAFGIAVMKMVTGFKRDMASMAAGLPRPLEHGYFVVGAYMCLIMAVFVSLYIGTDYSDGTIRNRLIVGHSRKDIYLSNQLTMVIGSIMITVAWLAGGLTGIPVYGLWQMGTAELIVTLVLVLLSAAAMTSILLLLCQMTSGRAVAAIGAIVAVFILLFLSSMLYNRLLEPEEIRGVVITMEGGLQFAESEPTPNYLSRYARDACKAILNILPTVQAILQANISYQEGLDSIPIQFVSDVAIIVLSSTIGTYLFGRKNLK